MSRVGRQPIQVPSSVEVQIEGSLVRVKGPKGELERKVRPEILVELKDDEIIVVPRPGAKRVDALWGLTRSLVANMVEGVTQGFEKKLEIQGVGYKATAEGDAITLSVGFSHPVKLKAPEGVSFGVDKNVIAIFGPDKEKVGQFASSIKKIQPVEPYKGKGIRYQGEQVRRKLGKRAAGEETAA